MLNGDFKNSYYFDNGSKVDPAGNTMYKTKGGKSKKGSSLAPNTELNLGSNMSTRSQSSNNQSV